MKTLPWTPYPQAEPQLILSPTPPLHAAPPLRAAASFSSPTEALHTVASSLPCLPCTRPALPGRSSSPARRQPSPARVLPCTPPALPSQSSSAPPLQSRRPPRPDFLLVPSSRLVSWRRPSSLVAPPASLCQPLAWSSTGADALFSLRSHLSRWPPPPAFARTRGFPSSLCP